MLLVNVSAVHRLGWIIISAVYRLNRVTGCAMHGLGRNQNNVSGVLGISRVRTVYGLDRVNDRNTALCMRVILGPCPYNDWVAYRKVRDDERDSSGICWD